jgi:hypothetical protein
MCRAARVKLYPCVNSWGVSPVDKCKCAVQVQIEASQRLSSIDILKKHIPFISKAIPNQGLSAAK